MVQLLKSPPVNINGPNKINIQLSLGDTYVFLISLSSQINYWIVKSLIGIIWDVDDRKRLNAEPMHQNYIAKPKTICALVSAKFYSAEFYKLSSVLNGILRFHWFIYAVRKYLKTVNPKISRHKKLRESESLVKFYS